jgi:hypothetical protein
MLGGAQRRTLFMLTAPTSVAKQAAVARQGRIECLEVGTPGAGLP